MDLVEIPEYSHSSVTARLRREWVVMLSYLVRRFVLLRRIDPIFDRRQEMEMEMELELKL